jgi:hypothetical protein
MLLSEANATGSEYTMLKINEPFVSSISKPAPGLLFAVPSDTDDLQDSLPAVTTPLPLSMPTPTASALTSAEEPGIPPPPGYHWWHLDTGATDFCSNRFTDLLAPIPTNQPIGTAATGSTSTIEAIGSMMLSATTTAGTEFLQSIPQVLGVPSFSRRSCSPHAFRALDYDAIHCVGK